MRTRRVLTLDREHREIRFALLAAAALLLMLLSAGSARAAYSNSSLSSTAGQLTSSVAVNQANQDVYAASLGTQTLGTLGNGEVKRFISGGGEETCLSFKSPFGVAVSATNVVVVDGSTSKTMRTYGIGTGCKTEASSFALAAMSTNAPAPQPAIDSAGRIYYPNNAVAGKVEVFQSTGISVGLTHPIEGLAKPNNVSLDSAGNIYVVEPRGVGVNEKQTITLQGSSTPGGTFNLSFAGETVTNISATESPANLKAKLAALPKIGTNNVAVAASGTNPKIYTVTFEGALGGANVSNFSCDATNLTPTGATCTTGTTTQGVAGVGHLFKYSPVPAAPNGSNEYECCSLLSTFYTGEITSAAVNATTGDVFVGVGYGGTDYPGKGFHVEKFSSAGVKLADFGDGQFSNASSSLAGIALNQLAVSNTTGTVYATDGAVGKVQVFTPQTLPKFLLKAEKIGSGAASGKVTSDIAGIDCGVDCEQEYEEQEFITLTAQGEGGSTFVKWESCPEEFGASNEKCRVKITAAKTVQAEFSGPAGKSLKVIKEGTGSGTVTSAQSGLGSEPINCGSHCEETFSDGTLVALNAAPAAHSQFKGWHGADALAAGCDETGATPTCEVTLSANKEVRATFTELPFNFSLSTAGGTGSGVVKCDGTTCASSYAKGTVLTLTATPDAHNAFGGWSVTGDAGTTCTGITSPCTVTVNADISVSAPFNQITHSFSVNTSGGTGTGVVKCNGVTCASSYPGGTALTLTATPDAHNEFVGWSVTGDPGTTCTGTTSPCTVTVEANISVAAPFNLVTHTLSTSNPGSGSGTLSCDSGSGAEACKSSYLEGTEVTISQSAAFGSEFKGWSGCDSEPAGNCKVTLSSNKVVTATFDVQPGQKALNVNKSGEGNVECKVGAGSFGACALTYPEGTQLTLQATAGPHATFSGWSGGTGSAASCSGTGNCSFTITLDSSVDAPFPLTQRTLATSKNGTGDGSFECKTTGSFGSCASTYADGTTITVKANPNASSTFVSWAGCSSTAANECTVTSISSNTTVTATFNLAQRTLTVTPAGTGSGSFTCDTGSGPGACAASYPDGTDITIAATPNAGSSFAGWSGGGCSGTGSCVINDIAANTTVTGTFNLIQRTLTITPAGTGNGSFECKTTGSFEACQSSYPNGTTITVKANPNASSTFVSWAGCSSTAANECTVTSISANTTVTATFNLAQRTLTVTPAGTGSGSFTCDTGSGPGACAASYPDGTDITIAATPNAGSNFAGWSAGSGSATCTGAGACVITDISANSSVTGTFNLNASTLTLNKTGSGGGSFTCDAGSGPAACASSYANGTTVTIAAVPNAHSSFSGWTGGGCSGTGSCVVTLSSNTTVSAAFPLAQRTLTIDKEGSGDGSFQCDTGAGYGPCQATYIDGTTLVVRANPAAHSSFASWTGCDSQPGTGKCAIEEIDADTTVTATFDQITHNLTINKAGSGSGSVICDGGACASSYPEGTTVTLKATPDGSSNFAGFSGACTGSGDCVLTIDSDKSVTATFEAKPAPSVAAPPVATGPPTTQKPRKCRKGTKKRVVRGKARCVKVKRHGRKGHRAQRIDLAELIQELF